MLMGANRTSKIFSGLAMNFENFKLFLLAYIFGKISPNIKIKKVMIMTSIKKTKSILKNTKLSSELTPLNSCSLSEAKSKTIPIFIKLLATKIVANNFFGRCSRAIIVSSAFEGVFSSGSKSDLLNENRATSAPEIRAEHTKRITRETPPNNKWGSIKFRNRVRSASK